MLQLSSLSRTKTNDSGERQDAPPSLTPRPSTPVVPVATYHTHVPAYTPPVYTPPRRRDRFRNTCGNFPWGVCFLIILYLGILAAQGVWIYTYIDTHIHPNPRKWINSTSQRWGAFTAFMWIFGTIETMINFYLFGAVALMALSCSLWKDGGKVWTTLCFFIVPPICIFFIIVPMWGCLIFIAPAQRQEYYHACDTWPLQVVLDGRGYKDPLYVPNSAVFMTAKTNLPLFTFDMEQTEPSFAHFHLRKFDVDENSIDATLKPAIRSITYDFVNLRINGTCVDDAPCLSGSFSTDRLAVDLQYNLTAGAAVTHSRAQSQDIHWSDKVLETATTKYTDCTQLKTCLAGNKLEGGGGPVGPDVMVALGLMVAKQASYSIACTTPSS
ncbi:hypothetical protein BKA62DRAFT_667478 [Auriculariales sp. MPI-PUGE-AT-0066]|nr:hypothetical protein BKA62DRAFT_667478 [Auriculariales sp. MPI-PUGE-AT-0066]